MLSCLRCDKDHETVTKDEEFCEPCRETIAENAFSDSMSGENGIDRLKRELREAITLKR
jgi:hypothetical protein